jgi:hypothetical protein
MWSQPCDCFENTMETSTTHSRTLCQRFHIRWLFRVRDEVTHLSNDRNILFHACWLIRPAAFARAKASLFSLRAVRIKLHMLWSS